MIEKIMKTVQKVYKYVVDYITMRNIKIDLLDPVMVLWRKNQLVNRVLFLTNIFVTVFILSNAQAQSISTGESISLLIPAFGINFLLAYFMNNKPITMEKQALGMYMVVLGITYIAFRVYWIDTAPYTYVLYYYALTVIALYQNKNAMLLGDVLLFVVTTFIHFRDLINPDNTNFGMYEFTIYTLMFLLFMTAVTASVVVAENLDIERKKELEKRRELESKFNNTVNNIFDTIHEVNELNISENDSHIFRVGLMAKKLASMMGYSDVRIKDIFDYAVIHGVERDFQGVVDEESIDRIFEDYDCLTLRMSTGNSLIRRIRLDLKCEEMVRTRYESRGGSDKFRKLRPEDSTVENQIVLLVDTYDKLRDRQLFARSMTHQKALVELQNNFGHFFDEKVLKTFMENDVEFEIIYERN